MIVMALLTGLQKQDRGIEGTDQAVLVEVDGEVLGYTDDYGTATMFSGHEPHKEIVEKAVEAASELWAVTR